MRRTLATQVAAAVAAVTLAAAALAPAQVIQTYTEAGLGYPVPTPVDTATAFDGFRTYDALQLRLVDLALSDAHVERHAVGTSIQGRSIDAYVLSDPDDVGPDGMPEGGVMFDATIHAREWASPEIAVRLIEHLADGYGTDPLATYLLDACRLVVIPVSNVDGFLQTQRTPAQYIQSNDGRMRRKNMNGADDILATLGDYAFGVDLNRNFPVGFGGGGATPTQETYRGPSALSEPESSTIAGAIDLFASPAQLRLYCDLHGAIPALYVMYNNVAAIDTPALTLANRLRASFVAFNGIANSYGLIEVHPGANIGASDEFFALTYGILAYTIEYPTPRYRVPGSGPTFILPDDEVAEVTEENIAALILMLYYASGPPILEEVLLWEDTTPDNHADPDEIVYEAHWEPTTSGGAPARTLVVNQPRPLAGPATLKLLLAFNKPMRVADALDAPGNLPGQSWPIQPSASVNLAIEGEGTIAAAAAPIGAGWLDASDGGDPQTAGFRRYAFDAWLGSVTLPGAAAGHEAELGVAVQDLYGHQLDARPATPADWDHGWIGFEDAAGAGDLGGTDNIHLLRTDLAPTTDAFQAR